MIFVYNVYVWLKRICLTYPVGCEDIIAEGLSLDNLLSILSWSSEPHGSKWVRNQALHFIQEEFLQILHSSVLVELSREYLKEALSSDFLQVMTLATWLRSINQYFEYFFGFKLPFIIPPVNEVQGGI